MPEAVDKLEASSTSIKSATSRAAGVRYSVGVCGERFSFENEADTRLQWTSDWSKAEFFIAPTHLDCDGALGGKVIATIERLGVPIGVVKDRRALLPREMAKR